MLIGSYLVDCLLLVRVSLPFQFLKGQQIIEDIYRSTASQSNVTQGLTHFLICRSGMFALFHLGHNHIEP